MPRSGDDLLASLGRTDRIHVLSRLGEGAVGLVERVFDARIGRVVARKTLRSELRGNENAIRAFVNEAKILGQLDHGSVIPIFDAYVNEEGDPVYTMREIKGRSLARVLEIDVPTGKATPLALDRTVRIIGQLGAALAHAHQRGVIHLDLKPANIIVLEYDRVVLVDWGTARIFAPERSHSRLEEAPELARFIQVEEDDDVLVGTPRYMSPEQTIARRSELGPESDVFSLGVLFYQMLTGRLPFFSDTLDELLNEIRRTEPPRPRELDALIPRPLDAIVMRMLEKQEWDRTPNMEAVLRDLDAFRSTAGEFPIREFAAGEILFSEGDEGDFAGVLMSGEVEIWTEVDGERRILGRVVEGEAVGELALLSDGTRSASASALTKTKIRVISAEAFLSEIEKLSPWIATILAGIVERFIERSERIVELLRPTRDD